MSVHRVQRGLDVPLAGAPEQVIHRAPQVTTAALLPRDTVGLRPRLLVHPGEVVRLGQPLYIDRVYSDVRYVAPGGGVVTAVNRGARRVIESVVIELDERSSEPVEFEHYSVQAGNTRESAQALLLESGLWPAFRTRPFSRVPVPYVTPHAIFVTAVDTHPHAPDMDVVLAAREAALSRGLAVLAKLTDGPVYLCRAEGSPIGDGSARVHNGSAIRVAEFAGPHPAGTAGYHIHTLMPVDRNTTVWHVGAQDVVRIGHLFATGTLDVTAVVSLGGPPVLKPRLLQTRLGASLHELVNGELAAPAGGHAQRVISGSVLTGTRADDAVHAFLGRYHQQVSVVAEGGARRLFGWMTGGLDRYSFTPAFLSALRARSGNTRGWALDTSLRGSHRAMVPIGAYERVMPMDLMPTHLLRAISVGDVEWAEELGVLELDEEDVALCTFVCPSKYDFGDALRRTLDAIVAEG